MKYLLRQFNLSASYAVSGKEAIALVQNRMDSSELANFQLILLDFSMPEMNGFECAKKIKSMVQNCTDNENIINPFICCVSAYNSTEFIQRAEQQPGIDFVMIKPIFKELMH